MSIQILLFILFITKIINSIGFTPSSTINKGIQDATYQTINDNLECIILLQSKDSSIYTCEPTVHVLDKINFYRLLCVVDIDNCNNEFDKQYNCISKTLFQEEEICNNIMPFNTKGTLNPDFVDKCNTVTKRRIEAKKTFNVAKVNIKHNATIILEKCHKKRLDELEKQKEDCKKTSFFAGSC